MSRFFSSLRAGIAALALLLGVPVQAQANLSLPSASLSDSLTALSKAAGVQIMADPALLEGKTAPALSGPLTPDSALQQLLRGSGLRFEKRGDTYLILQGRSDATEPEATASAPQPTARAERSDPDTSMEQVIVTGTHIARPELQSVMPIAVLSMESAKNFGYNTVYDALQLNPAIGPGLGETNSGGQEYDKGVANINLRNMGTNRSLVLVDGQRWVSGGARISAVDLNTIPSAMIDRVEVVTGGAAAIYGADAVTGAVNIIMKQELSGLHLAATSGISSRGDANQSNFSLATGSPFGAGRGHFVIGGDYTYTAPLDQSDRFTHRQIYYPNPANTGPHDGIADNILTHNWEQLHRAPVPTFCIYGNKSCYVTSPVQNGQWYQLINGLVTPVPHSSFIQPTPGETGFEDAVTQRYGANAWEEITLRDKSEKGSLYAHSSYELMPALTWNTTLCYAHSFDRGTPEWPQIRDDARPKNWFGGTTGEIATLDNPYLPDSLRQFMVDNNITQISMDRTYTNLPRAYEIHSRNNITVGTDIGGKLIDALTWIAFVRYGQVVDHITTTNMIGRSEWLNARNTIADPVTGAIECADPAARAAGCAPFNFFSTAAPSQSWIDYAEFNRHERTENSLLNTGANLTGNVFSLPYGDVSAAAGMEWRQEKLHTRDDPDTAKLSDIVYAPGEDYARHPALDRGRDTAELYGETVIPLLADLPFAKRVSVEGAYRWSHYSDNPHTGTWKAGATWAPVTAFSLRGVYSHSTRVPNFGELFSPPSTSTLGQINDPCQRNFINQNVTRAANCAAIIPGVAVPLPSPNSNAEVIYSGGNANLTPETSNSFTLGAVLQPTFLNGFDLTVDYWDIKIDNVITALDYLTILNNCVDSAGGPNQAYCQFVQRNPDGTVSTVQAQYANLSGQRARGLDFGATYRTAVGTGLFRANFSGTRLIEQTIVAQAGKAGIDYAGQWNYPTFKFTLMTDYAIGQFTVGLNTRFISRGLYSATAASNETYQYPHVPTSVYNDLTVQYRPLDQLGVTIGVKNIGNVGVFGPLQDNAMSPHLSNGAVASPGGTGYYDAIGRYFFVKINADL